MLPLSVLVLSALSITALAALDLFPSTASYPFAIHLPLNPISTPPPAILFLHGSGSRGGEDVLDSQTLWDGVGWLLSQYERGNRTGAQQIVAEQYLSILPLLPSDQDEWDPASILSVLNTTADLAASNASFAYNTSQTTLAGYSLGSFAVWNTFFFVGYPTPFAALLPCAGTATYSSSQLLSLASPPTGSSPVSVLGLSSTDDEKQPPQNTEDAVEAIQQVAEEASSAVGNWTTRTLRRFNHKGMSQEVWMDEEVWWWVGNQTQVSGGGKEEPVGLTAIQVVEPTVTRSSSSSSVASASATGVVGSAAASASGGAGGGQENGASRMRPFRWW